MSGVWASRPGSTPGTAHAIPTPDWPQVWIGTPTCKEEASTAWSSRNSANYRRDPGLYTRWSEDGEIWYTDPNFEQAFEVLQVPAEAIQVAGVRL